MNFQTNEKCTKNVYKRILKIDILILERLRTRNHIYPSEFSPKISVCKVIKTEHDA